MQITVNSPNILVFGFSVVFDTNAKTITFDTTQLTTYVNMSNHGALFVQGIGFGLTDQDGVELVKFDMSNPQLPTPATQGVYVYDASALNFAFLFQTYKIQGAIKDQNGMIYSVDPVYKKVCQPTDFNDSGYVNGVFQVIPNCVNNTLTVKELTNFTLCNAQPESKTKDGLLYYPTGTISPVAFTATPFSNNVIYTGQYRLTNDTVATYNLNDDVYETVTYHTDSTFDVTCANRMSDVICCIVDLQTIKEKNCDNAKGERAAQQLENISVSLMTGLLKEINGQDASTEADFIKKTLNCNCGKGSILQNEFDPINAAISSIVITGVGGTTVTPSVNGTTNNFVVASNIYQVVKNDSLDTAFSIIVDTATSRTVKYKIQFNYAIMANSILTAIAASPSLITFLNTLVTATTNIDLTNLNGKCIVNLGSNNYFLSLLVPSQITAFEGITINNTFYPTTVKILVTDTSSIQTFINNLGLGVFQVGYSTGSSGAYFNVTSNGNANVPNSVRIYISNNGIDSISNPLFQHTNVSLVALLQAIIDYLCGITSLQVTLGSQLALCTFDYNGNVVVTSYLSTVSQGTFNAGVASSICNLANRINTLTGVTCAKVSALFQDNPSSDVSRLYGFDGRGCVAFTDQQVGLAVIRSIQNYQNVKDAFCAISCSTPAICPDVSGISINMSGSNIGIYGLTWATVPNATQTISVKYRLHGNTTWIIATNSLSILPNGNISGTSPYLITGVSAGSTYDIQAVNNCGGVGFTTQFTTPTGGIYSGNYTLDNVLYLICGNNTVTTLYSSSPFGVGVTLYTNMGLSTPTTGHIYIRDLNTGEIYNLNTSTGVVGTDTLTNCNTGTPNTYSFGNSTATICSAGGLVTAYTNGAFAVGKTLYIDAALTTPKTGFAYVVYNNVIFNLNTSTGVIGSSTGLSCVSNVTLTMSYSQGTWSAALDNPLPYGITINGMEADGSILSGCSSADQTDNITALTMASGSVAQSQTNSGLTCTSNYFKVKNIMTINGNSVTNGGTVVISGVTITAVILNTNCSTYTC